MYIDLNWEVKTNAEFLYRLQRIYKDVEMLERKAAGDPNTSDKIAEKILDIYRLCKYNTGLLLPYFFPAYPYDKPLSCTARPYAYAMFHMQIGGFMAFRAGRQIGKALEENEPCLTPGGWVRISDIKVDDIVYDGLGNPTRVTGVYPQGVRPAYKMTFTDGSHSVCDEEHLWLCKKGGKSRNFSVRSLKQIRARKGRDNPTSDQGIRIPLTRPIQFPEVEHYIKPYTLGLLLGDGCLSKTGTMGFTSADPELGAYLNTQDGIRATLGNNYQYRISNDAECANKHNSKFRQEITRLDLRHTAEFKHIPIEYIYDSVENRLELLRGLMDTDGTIYGKCQVEYYSTSRTLAEQVQFLVQSLGGKATIKEKQGYYKKMGLRVDCKLCYRVMIKIQDVNPFRLKRKADRFYNIRYERTRVLKKIEYTGEANTVCITVASPTKTFITRDCIVTHNSSSFAARQLINAHIIPKHRSMYIVPHQSYLDTYANRLREMERAFKFYSPHKDFRQNLKYKEYPNEAVTQLVKCLTDTQEARSKTTAEALFDECVHMNTTVMSYVGESVTEKKISMFLDGDVILTYDMVGNIKPSKILKILNKGKKHVYRLRFSNNTELICTGNTRFWTSHGWMFACEFLSWEDAAKSETAIQAKTLLALREAATPGDSSWRRMHTMGREIVSTVGIKPRSCAGGLLYSEIRSNKTLRKLTAEDCRQSGLGRQMVPPGNADDSRVQFYASPVLPSGSEREAGKNSNQRMAGSVNLGGDSLVVPGRRDIDASQRGTYKHALVPLRASTIASGYAGKQGSGSKSSTSKEGGKNVFYSQYRSGIYKEVCLKDRTVYTRVDEVQDRHKSASISNVSFLSDSLSMDNRSYSRPSVLSGQVVSKDGEWDASSEGCREGRGIECVLLQQGEASGAERPNFQREAESYEGTPRPEPGIQGEMGSYKSAMEEGQHGEGLCAESCKNGRSGVRPSGKSESGGEGEYSRKESQEAGATKTTETESSATKLIPIHLLSTEYVGMEEVWDIETESKTFFANGIAIHNCQFLDPDFLPDIEQCQKASDMPSTIYAGTSTTMETLLETKFLASSQASWLVRAPGFESASAGTGWINCGDKEDVLKCIRPMGFTNPVNNTVLDVTDGHFVHQDMARFDQGYLGFHIPQIIIPDYANKPEKWMEVWNAYETYDIKKFLQEILGIPTEEGMREITLKDLKAICVLPETPETLKELANATNGRYKYTVSGCDWGGSDYNPASKTKVSFTVHAILGINWDGSMDILHMRQYSGMDYRSISDDICKEHREYGCIGLASDYGVGAAYNMLLRENPAIQPERHIIFGYVGPQSSVIKATAGSSLMNHFSLNRTESITTLYQAVRDRRIRCYHWGLAQDRLLEFLNLFRVPTEGGHGQNTFKYQRHGAKADDTLHAVNFAYCLGRIIMNEPIVEDQALKRMFQSTFSPGLYPQHLNPFASGGMDMGGVISG